MKKILKPALWALYFLAIVVVTYVVAKGSSQTTNSPKVDSHVSNPGQNPNPNQAEGSRNGVEDSRNGEADPMEVLKKGLAEKEAQLAAKESEVQSMKELLSQKEEEIQNLETRIQQLTAERGQTQKAEFAKLSKAYAAMKPQQVAELLKALDKPTALKILTSMREREAAKVMEEMGPGFVKELTQNTLKGDQ